MGSLADLDIAGHIMEGNFPKFFTSALMLGISLVAGAYFIHLLFIPGLQILFRWIGKRHKLDLLSAKDKDCLLHYSGIVVIVGSIIILIHTIAKYFYK